MRRAPACCACSALPLPHTFGESLQRREEEHDDRRGEQARHVAEFVRRQLPRAFRHDVHERDHRGHQRRLPDRPADAQVDVEQLRAQDAVGDQRHGDERSERIDEEPTRTFREDCVVIAAP